MKLEQDEFRATIGRGMGINLTCSIPIVGWIGTWAYQLQLAPSMKIHSVFHVSLLEQHDGCTQLPPPPVMIGITCFTLSDGKILPTPENLLRTDPMH